MAKENIACALLSALLLGAVSAGAGERSDAERYSSEAMNVGVVSSADRPVEGGVRVLFLGNSITLHGPLAAVGWTNNWGMAASCAERDYVHLVTRGIEAATGRRADVRVRNLSAFEKEYAAYDLARLDELVAFRPEYLVVALGENVPVLAREEDKVAFREAFGKLLARFTYGRTKPNVVVRGAFWPNPEKDALMAHAASDLAMTFVSAPRRDMALTAEGAFAHKGVAAHPGDKGMAEIAARILEGFFPTNAGYAAWVDGRETPVMPIRVSAMPFNQWAPGYQRPADQTEVAGMLRFETAGAAEVRVRPLRTFRTAVVRPVSANVACTVASGEVRFTLPKPGYYVLEVDGCHRPLEIFADRRRDFSEERKAANIVFGPGRHEPVVVKLKSHDRVYIDREAIVFGSFQADGVEDVRVSGYGVISGARNRRVGNACYREGMDGAVRIIDSKRIVFDGPAVVDSCCWCVAAFNSSDIEFANLKVTGAWRYNTDGIDICNSQRVRVHDCYVHSFDDSLVVKGISHDYVAAKGVLSTDFKRDEPIEDVRFSRCVCWCGWGRTLEIGLESFAPYRGIVFEDCDLIHNSAAALSVHLGGNGIVEDATFRNIRIEYAADAMREVLQRSRDQKYPGGAAAGGRWLSVSNEKMFGGGFYGAMAKLAALPNGTFRNVTVEDIDLFVESGAAKPRKFVRCEPGTSFGTLKIGDVRLNGRPLDETDE